MLKVILSITLIIQILFGYTVQIQNFDMTPSSKITKIQEQPIPLSATSKKASKRLHIKGSRFTLLKDNPSGNCRKWHIPHSFYFSINLPDKTVINLNIPYFLTVLVLPPLMDCDFLNQLIQKWGGKLVNGTVFLD